MNDYDMMMLHKINEAFYELWLYDTSGDHAYGVELAQELVAELELQGLKIVEIDSGVN